MNNKQNKTTIYQLSFTAIMAALVFVCTYINIQIPLPGTNVMIHLGNVLCILSALILGPLFGGLSAGIGSFIFDLTNPLYIASSPFTLVFKFLMGFICGKIAFRKGKKGEDTKNNILAASIGLVCYIILHLSKTFITNMFLQVELEANLILVAESAAVSLLNAVLAIVIAVPLGAGVRRALNQSGILDKLGENR